MKKWANKCYQIIQTDFGPLLLAEDGIGISDLCFLPWEQAGEDRCTGHSEKQTVAVILENGKREETELLLRGRVQLEEYFQKKRREFQLPLSLEGTEFQKLCWNALCTIPYGQTCSYGELAGQIGKPKACRAVGMANHRNPVSIIVPCHRVIGADGSLTGYGGGLELKRRLLDLESC
ncbi:MAG: methylated-DNA--[protein]-cysteine S-methyltransferase [Candidatus Limivivens sp.]|nr:methylated-DNA--[protein]-cysteine S-methyltransferase [Candidatus Limivivens sp.]